MPDTLSRLFRRAISYDKPDAILAKHSGQYQPISSRELYRRVGTPGTATRVLGARVARPIRTTAADAQIRVPPTIAPRTLWLSATTADGRALIGLGG